MEQQNDNSDKTTFKVEFLGEYHDVVIDWNDDKYICKGKQLFEQLESITGVSRQCNAEINVYEPWWDPFNTQYHIIRCDETYDLSRFAITKEQILDSISYAEGRFRLAYENHFDIREKKAVIYYYLVAESSVPQDECCFYFCQYKNSKTVFDKVKDIFNNDQLIAKFVSLDQLQRLIEVDEILRQFNVLQYFLPMCHERYWRQVDDEICLYLRTRG
ncbi:uncharacterized protein LOC107365425 [Tetranychus urticae]|uniref:Uncharacterized protein n=1 Tax=Tetranychus urticae TaxID=32264 RepID=T1KMV3_TETUR|nr:uncharacterized protein LOC107365425 [Tetranychus urticae]